MNKMRAVQVPFANGPFELVERDIPAPDPGWLRIRVEACGICHGDSVVKTGTFPGLTYPRIPGHEVAGIVDALGDGVEGWSVGQRVGVGWNGGYCGECGNCRRGDFFACQLIHRATGINYDGGFADYMVAPVEAVARIPQDMPPADAAPLMCAGLTTYNALRNSGARAGDTVAILGLGGLGHLGVQYAAKMGFRTIAIARGPDKAVLALELGAAEYIDSLSEDPAKALASAGGASVILATVTNGDAMAAAIGGLAVNGTLMVIGAPEQLCVSPVVLLTGRRSVKGWYSGTAIDSQETLEFSDLTGVRSMNEVYPLERVSEAYDQMISGRARFRVVVTMGG